MSSPAVTPTPGHHGLWRWLVALVATVMLVVSGSGLVVFAQSGTGESRGPQFVPADAAVYVEARTDLPGDQAEALPQFMTAFPGFADAGSFGLKSDQLLDDLFDEATDGAMSYSGDLKDFLTGEMGLAVMDIESAMNGDDPAMVIGIAISDRAAAQSFLDLMLAGQDGDDARTEETYGAAQIVSDDSTAVALTDEWILISPSVDDIKASVDILAGTAPSLADDPDFVNAFSRLPASRLGAAYMNLQSFGSILDMAGLMASGQAGMEMPTTDLAAMLPKDMAAYLAVEADRMTLEAFITPGEGTPAVAVGDSELAMLFPADTQLYLETRELGMTVENSLNSVFQMMEEDAMEQVAPIESMLGEPLPTFLDFVADAGVGAGLSSDGLWLGIAAEVTDEEIAAERIERILSIVRLMGSGAEAGIEIDETTVGDTEVTVITVPIDDAMAGSGLPISIGDTISVALNDGTMLMGTGDFVESALTGASVDSLGASAGYTDALAADTVNTGVLYANIGSLLAELDPMISMMVPEWSDVQPYATALDRLIAVGTAEDDVLGARMTVIVNQ
jgi:hypothetical protein